MHINLRDIMVTSSGADSQETKINAEVVKSDRTMTLVTETGTANPRANCPNQTRTRANRISEGEAGRCNSVSGLLNAYTEPNQTVNR